MNNREFTNKEKFDFFFAQLFTNNDSKAVVHYLPDVKMLSTRERLHNIDKEGWKPRRVLREDNCYHYFWRSGDKYVCDGCKKIAVGDDLKRFYVNEQDRTSCAQESGLQLQPTAPAQH